ncbi:MAG TPA: hypothetical protein VMJ10_15765 [Kofleriaceae bacterium]|nr:hypothetical protein [Kofleriaceae bacterium]
MTVSVARADDTKKNVEFCQALSDFHADMKTLDNIGAQSTIGELRSAVDRSSDDARKVEKAATKIKSPTSTVFVASAKKLKSDARDLPDNITIEQAKAKLQDDIQKLKDSEKQMTAEAGCPEEGMSPDQNKMK